MELAGKRVLVVGLGASGIAAAELLLARGARVIGNDARSAAELSPEAQALAERGVELCCGGHDPALFAAVDRIVVSPGVPPLPALQAAERAGVPIVGEVELAAAFLQGTLIGITGTNGKSTVTTLVGEICRSTGRPTFVGGNLGTPLASAVGTQAAGEHGYLVVELSSFQLERAGQLRLRIAALLNVTPDHLDRYPSFEDYAQAKAAIFRNQTPEDAAVVPSGDPLCEQLARQGHAALHWFGGEAGAVHVAGDRIVDEATGLSLPLAELAIAGRHNHENACAAALIARLAGAPAGAIEQALRSFRGLPHRMVLVRRLDGVDYYDDSKATNVGATAAALDGLSDRQGRVVLIAGGKHKGGDYGPVAQRMQARGRAALLIGEAAPLLDAALSGGGYPVERAASLEHAVARARELAQPGDAVLLAPACSSYDMFKSYAHRGDVFQAAVHALDGGER